MSDSEIVISVENLSKRYRLGVIGATTLRESVERWWHRMRGRDPAEEMGVVGQPTIQPPASGLAGGHGEELTTEYAEYMEKTKNKERTNKRSPFPFRVFRVFRGRKIFSASTNTRLHPSLLPPSSLSSPSLNPSSLWALRDVSFEVKRGEVLGIIGRNGAGKSTLLKILSRITEPTGGRAVLRGRVGSLLEVGTGFEGSRCSRSEISRGLY